MHVYAGPAAASCHASFTVAALICWYAFIPIIRFIITTNFTRIATYAIAALIIFRNADASKAFLCTRGTGTQAIDALLSVGTWRIACLLVAGACENASIIAAFILTGNAIHVTAGNEAVVTVESDIATGRFQRANISAMVAVFIRARAGTIAALLLLPAAVVATAAVIRVGLQICACPLAAIISDRTGLGLTGLAYSCCADIVLSACISIIASCAIQIICNARSVETVIICAWISVIA